MTAPEIAKKLLELFGPNGLHWYKRQGYYDGTGKRCLGGGLMALGLSLEALDQFIFPCQTIESFNDRRSWPEIKSWLEGIATLPGGK